jgi:hypothetical protein
VDTGKSIVKYKSKWIRGVLHDGKTVVVIERDGGDGVGWGKVSLTVDGTGEDGKLLQQFLVPAFFPVAPTNR